MAAVLVAIGAMLLGGGAAFASAAWPRRCGDFAVAGVVVGSLVAIIPAVRVLLGGAAPSLRLAWDVPYGSFFVGMDALSAFFVALICLVAPLAAVWGRVYLLEHPAHRSLGPPWLFFNLLVASMMLVVIARNAVLFLVAWEVMALASFFLVTFHDQDEAVRDAGWTYLVATHLGTAFLLALFVLLGSHGASLDFDHFSAPATGSGLLFLLAVIGFGAKAGFVPFHVWLPEAHPAAPSHVSAVMSGLMIKTGIYGLIRVITFLGPPPAWWGGVLMAIGLVSAIYGVLFALAQSDLKRILAYSSIENSGVIALGLGVGLLGVSAGAVPLAALGFAGALLHVLNHALFKSLLFLGAGAVAQASGSREIEGQGGLLARMPWTGATFFVGAVAIAGLPPLNGFMSEWLIYLGTLRAAAEGSAGVAAAAVAAIAGLALVGGLAAACFARAFGVVFLGEPRSDRARGARETGVGLWAPLLLLAALCVLSAALAPLLLRAAMPLVSSASGLPAAQLAPALSVASGSLAQVVGGSLAFVALIALAWGLRRWLLARHPAEPGVTWDCGYAAPSPRMQYTASSFAEPLTTLFAFLLQTRRRLTAPAGFFPSHAELTAETLDLCTERLYRPLFATASRGLARARWLQHGRVQVYILYIALTLLVLLAWELG